MCVFVRQDITYLHTCGNVTEYGARRARGWEDQSKGKDVEVERAIKRRADVFSSAPFHVLRWMNWVQLSSFGEIKLSFNIFLNFSPRHRRNEVTPRTNTSASAAVSVSSGFIARMTKLTYLLPLFRQLAHQLVLAAALVRIPQLRIDAIVQPPVPVVGEPEQATEKQWPLQL